MELLYVPEHVWDDAEGMSGVRWTHFLDDRMRPTPGPTRTRCTTPLPAHSCSCGAFEFVRGPQRA
jgi:hypothetical protein